MTSHCGYPEASSKHQRTLLDVPPTDLVRDDDLILRRAGPHDCDALARLYAECLPDDLACRMGHRFLRQLFFVLTKSPATTISFAVLGPCVVGFSVITASRRIINRSLIPDLVIALLLRPRLLFSLALQAFRPSFLRSFFGEPDRSKAGWREVYLIGVVDTARGRGIGGRVLDAALADGPAEVPCMAKTLSERAVVFYQRYGFRPIGEEQRGKHTLTVLGLEKTPKR